MRAGPRAGSRRAAGVRRRAGALLAAAGLVVAPIAPAHAAAPRAFRATASYGPGAPELVVDPGDVETLPPRVLQQVQRSATSMATNAAIPPSAIRITFVEVDPAGGLRGVRVLLEADEGAVVDPKGDPRGPLVYTCPASCTDAELGELAIEAVSHVIWVHQGALEAAEAEGEAAEAEAEAAKAASEPEPLAAPPSSERRPLGPLGWSGIGALGLGTGAAITGAVLASRPGPPSSGERHGDLRALGFGMLGVGGALAVTGAVLLAVDRRRARAARLVDGAPWVGPGGFGLAVTLRLDRSRMRY